MKWISVDEKEPELGEECLVCSHDNCYFLATLCDDCWFPFILPDFETRKKVITHWMKLPKLPKRKKNDNRINPI